MIRRTFLKGAAAVSFSLMVSPALTAFAKDSVRVYVGGPIFTMNKNNDIAEAIAVKGETILAVGKKAEVMAAAGSGATVVDLKGKALIPGMIDGHSHFPSGAFNELTMVNLNVPPLGRAESIADMQSLLKERAAQTKKGEWIVGYNYNDLAIKEQRHPTRADLDAVSTEHPIFVKHVSAIRPKPTAAQYEEAVRRDNMIYAAAGITTANNGGSPTVDDFFLKASENGDLGIRVVIWPNGRNAKLIESYGEKRQGAQLDKAGKVFLGPAKLFADGSPQGYTAWFSKPYFKQLPGKPADFRGFPVFNSQEELFALVQKLHDAGWQITTHTNGDQAIQDMIDAYSAALEKNPRKDHRHILNHCQFCRPDQVVAIAEKGFVPSYFVTHTWFWGDIHRDMVAGPERAAHISPLKAALDHKITFALHNDTPVTPISPLMDVFSAVNRLTSSGKVLGPDQRIDVMEALRGVTINGAYMQRLEDKIGSLEKGKLADMVILDKDPTKVDPVKLKDIMVEETIVGGNTVYKRA